MKSVIILVFYVIISQSAAAQTQQIEHSYVEAYNLCSPVAHQMTKIKCNYGRVFEDYYIMCMHNKGYNDEENFAPTYYSGYMQAYKFCSIEADSNTKQYCNYGGLFNSHYTSCMGSYGFDHSGEKIITGNTDKPAFEFNF